MELSIVFATRGKLSLYLKPLVRLKTILQVFSVGNVAQLIRDNLSRSNLRIYITMRVTIHPVIDVYISNKVAQLYRKRTIYEAASKLRRRT